MTPVAISCDLYCQSQVQSSLMASFLSLALLSFGSGQSPPNQEVVGFCLYTLTATDFVTQK